MVSIEIWCVVFIHILKKESSVFVSIALQVALNILPGALQGSVLGPALCNLFFNDLFFCILIVSAHNFADGNSWSSFVANVEDLIELLQSRHWTVYLDKQKANYTGTKLTDGS